MREKYPSMQRYRNLLFYVLTVAAAIAIIWWILTMGGRLQTQKNIKSIIESKPALGVPFTAVLRHNIREPLAILLLQIFVILLAGSFMGFLFKKIKQPRVIGEMAAGILLGASFLGYYFPEVSAFVFPPQSLGNLNLLSQIGLVLFMFIVGLELDLSLLKGKTNAAVMISHTSIIVPFTLGVATAYFTYQQFAPAGVQFISYALFIGISLSITAFPVLARIIQERNLSKTNLGVLAITCAAADDVTAWCILALVIAVVKAGSAWSALYTILLSVAYILVMIKVLRPLMANYYKRINSRLTAPFVAVCMIILVASAYLTDAIGIHALFGAFVAGMIMPADMEFRTQLIEKIESVALLLLLPLFFVSTGLKTQIALLNNPALWSICIIVLIIAVIAKFGASAAAARFTGQSWSESLQLGALMNTRGLTELVVLNIGYDLGVISQEIFTILVIMALSTTLMTGPALNRIQRLFRSSKEAKAVTP
ncbi:Kef-type K+ transport system, membrane component KefB [Niabella drilacis]|uniref:Kef-type K+ transport system, membrane component KefB n=2 Tax=Niabella drilacis (strain DSM 25811 / CCM 8410 / CCUG 62505 / LMG 26954 / E90) TaxID=1285928 RepID=A0A1G6W8H5_NIADE|nr:Kef-type K+ transport system, membrane component KefB [Niabella drilacis]